MKGICEFGSLSAHLGVAATLHAVGVSVIFSTIGSITAYFLSDRIGSKVPIAVGISLTIAAMCAMVFASRTAMLFLAYISLLQIALVFLNCYLYSALIEANNLLVPAAMPMQTFGAALGAGVMGYALEHGGPVGSLGLSVGAMCLTALLTMPFLPRHTANHKGGLEQRVLNGS
jgi:hypothetical protein